MRFIASRKLGILIALAQLYGATCALVQYASTAAGGTSEASLPPVSTALDAPATTLQATGTLFQLTAATQPASPTLLDNVDPNQSHRFEPLCAVCDEGPKRSIVAFVGYDAWKGVSDGGWQNNGINAGLNFGTSLGQFSELTGIGFQLGASMAAYNWGGTDFKIARQNEAQPQGFVTYGFFHKANADSNWNAAIVQDWMLNSNFGEFAENPTLSQGRAQVGYVLNAANEVGLWGTFRTLGDTRNVAGFGPTSWRPINQLNVFAHHKWSPGGADTSIWVGLPERDRLGGNGSLGDYQIGIQGNFPLSDHAAVYTLITYMHASAAAGPAGFDEESWNFTIGLALYPAGNARSSSVAGQCWVPQLPVANNGYFLVDTNRTF